MRRPTRLPSGFRANSLLLASLLLSCGDAGGPSGSRPTTMVVEPGEVVVDQADSVRLQVIVLDEHGEEITGIYTTFVSAAPSLVTVSATGTVRSVGAAGETAVTVYSGSGAGKVSREVPVTVVPVTESIVVTPNPVLLDQAEAAQVTAVALDPFGEPVPGARIQFTSHSPALFSVTASGLVIASTAFGSGTLVVASGGSLRSVPVKVAAVPTSITMEPSSLDLYPGQRGSVQAVVRDVAGVPIPGLHPRLTSSNPGILHVDPGGAVSAPGPLGTGVVSAAEGTLGASIPFSVTMPDDVAGRALLAESIFGVAVSATGVVYAAAPIGGVARGTLPSFEMSFTHAPGSGWDVAFSPAGDAVFVTGIAGSNVVTRLDPANDAILSSSPPLPATVRDLAVAHGGDRVFAGLVDGRVIALEAASLEVVGEVVPAAGYVEDLALHPALPLIYVSSPGSSRVFEVDQSTLDIVREFDMGMADWSGLAISADGRRLFVANYYRELHTVELPSGLPGPTFPAAHAGFDLELSADGASLWMTVNGIGEVLRLNASDGALITRYRVAGRPQRIAVQPGGPFVAVANQFGWVDFIDTSAPATGRR